VSRIKDMRKIARTGTFEYLCSAYKITRSNYKEFLHRSDVKLRRDNVHGIRQVPEFARLRWPIKYCGTASYLQLTLIKRLSLPSKVRKKSAVKSNVSFFLRREDILD